MIITRSKGNMQEICVTEILGVLYFCAVALLCLFVWAGNDMRLSLIRTTHARTTSHIILSGTFVRKKRKSLEGTDMTGRAEVKK